MKHLSFLMLLTFVVFTATAQEAKIETGINSNSIDSENLQYNGKSNTVEKPLLPSGIAGTSATIDTLTELYDRADSLVLWTYNQDGNTFLLAGTNNRYIFVGSRYDFSGYATVKGALVSYGYHRIRGNADNYSVLVYHTNTNGLAAGSPIGTTNTFSGSTISTTGFTHIPLNNYVGVQNNFAVMVQVNNSAASGDSLDMVGINGSNAGKGNGEQRALAFRPGSSQGSFSSVKIANDISGFNADLMILPIIEVAPAGVGTTLEGMTFNGVYPNPAINNATLQFSLENTENVTIMLVDMNGRIVKEVANKRMQAGTHNVNIDVTDVKSGVYFYTIVAGNAKMASKLVVE